ncbi:MAG: 2-C-methyl-D-erythritol 4-phosphate cytidylyltransferase [Alcanivorax sp.]|nr:2-C-methyl-D-erythritol 4-phosphate cytidylyltransferase [Alcanivorax sp.]MBU58997.1 2-C-methyl-D-erythritol 4-phosphate cytidylyltransferase [Alcanivorax sp.]UWN48296.1 2-C-methyl-D-erythritol 4-phosphate cytidylyltransferase [Alcanivorax sp. ALC70]HCE39805.1 2-C-methyl-D-erythritol 4-phosphate cytidylyltransferase [Alcanivorax sp.]
MTPSKPRPLYAVVPAAGVGARMGAALPKQYLTLEGRTVAEHTLTRLLAFAPLRRVVVAVAAGDPWWPELDVARHRRVEAVTGGASRAASVRAGVAAVLARDPDAWVMVHDMARPLVRLSDIQALVDGCGEDGAILARRVTDTIKRADGDDRIAATLDRRHIWRALTPQLFPARALHDALGGDLGAITDEASALEATGRRPALVEGRADNIKITLPEDLALARFYLGTQEEEGLAW